jgi:malonate transporter and related proteins
MELIIGVIVPFFALIACGYGAGRLRLLSQEGISGLNTFVLYFAVPALLFRAMAIRPLEEIFHPTFMAAFALAGLVVFAVMAVAGLVFFSGSLGVSALRGQAASVANLGYMGPPLMVALLGEAAAVPVILGLTVDVMIMFPLTIALLEVNRRQGGGGWAMARNLLRSMIVNPFSLSILAGISVSALQIALPGPVDVLAKLLTGAAAPCGMFALGATLASRPVSSGLGQVAFMSAGKLFLHPLAMWAVMTFLFDFDPLWVVVAVLAAALPVAGNVFTIARHFDVYVTTVSTTVLVSTTAAVITFSALAAVMIP